MNTGKTMSKLTVMAGVCIGSAFGVLAAPPVTDGLKLWLDASDAASLGVDATGQVSQWSDLSGGGHHAVQVTESMRPTYTPAGLAGRASLSFNGANVMVTASFMNYSNHTIFVVAQATATAENDILSSGTLFTGNDILLMNFANIYRGHYWFGSGGDYVSADSVLPSIWAPAIYEQTVDDASLRISRNGQLDRAVAAGGPHPDVLKPVCLGSRFINGGANFVGEMSEVLVYDRALSDAERMQVSEYLAAKWLIKSVGVPPVTAGLRLWLDAGDASSLVTGAGGKVSQWKNLTGMERTAAQGTAEYQPTYNPTGLNGKASLSFNGMNALATPVFINYSNHTVFVVAKAAALANNDMLGSDNEGDGNILLMNFGSRFRGHYWTSVLSSFDGWTSAFKPVIYEQTVDDATLKLHMNGLLAGTKGIVGAASNIVKPVCLGDRRSAPGPWSFVGEMSEVLVYDRALGDAERGQVEAYLAAKWSIGAATEGALPVTLGLQLWLDAANAPSLVKDENGKVSQWNDATGLGHHAAQAAVGSQPTFNPTGIKWHPSLSFSGAAVMPTPDFMNFSNHTVMVVAKATEINRYIDILGSNGTNPGDVLLMNVVEGKNRGHYWHSSGLFVIDSASPSVLTPVIYEQLLDDASMKLYRRGETSGQLDGMVAATALRPSTLKPVVLGHRFAGGGGENFIGEMSEVLVYERALSDTEREQVEAYLVKKCLTPPPGTLIRVQ